MKLSKAIVIANDFLMRQEGTNAPLSDLIMESRKSEKAFQKSYETLLDFALKCELGEYVVITDTEEIKEYITNKKDKECKEYYKNLKAE